MLGPLPWRHVEIVPGAERRARSALGRSTLRRRPCFALCWSFRIQNFTKGLECIPMGHRMLKLVDDLARKNIQQGSKDDRDFVEPLVHVLVVGVLIGAHDSVIDRILPGMVAESTEEPPSFRFSPKLSTPVLLTSFVCPPSRGGRDRGSGRREGGHLRKLNRKLDGNASLSRFGLNNDSTTTQPKHSHKTIQTKT